MRDDNDSFKRAFDNYISEIRSAHDEEAHTIELWKEDIRSHFYNLRTAIESCGMDSKLALDLSMKDPAPTRQRNTFLYLQYRVALAYANAIEIVQLIKGVSDPWKVSQILKMLAAFDNDAFCHADELVSLCEDWWSSAR